MNLRRILAYIFLGSFGIKLLALALCLLGVPYLVTGILLVTIVGWRCVTLYTGGRREQYIIRETPAEKGKRFLDADTVPVKIIM